MRGERLSDERGGVLSLVAVAGAGAVAMGLVVITATVLGVDTLRATCNVDLSFYFLVGGTLTGILVAGFAAWRLLEPVGSTYRRGGLSIVCAFATVILMLICIPVHQQLGRLGLLILLGLFGVTAMLLARRARRLMADQ